jgi:spoIIIJ-associated protein
MELALEQDRFDVEILETQKTSLFKKGYVKIRVHTEDSEGIPPARSKGRDERCAPESAMAADSQEGVTLDGRPEHARENRRDTFRPRGGGGEAARWDTSRPAPQRRSQVQQASRGREKILDSAVVAAGVIANPAPQDEFEQKMVTFITTVIQKMGYQASAEIMLREEAKLIICLTSESSSILIGRKGKNLEALQMVLNVYADHLGRGDLRIILDTENYRIRHEESLVRLAYSTADKVRSRGGSLLLEPMNPFERRLVHTALNDIQDIETKSEGEGLYKQVRVIYRGRA